MGKIDKEISEAEISNWFLMNVYIIVIPPIAKAVVTFIIGYGIDFKAIFTDYSLMVFAIIFNVVSLIYDKTEELLLGENEKLKLRMKNKYLYLYAAGCAAIYLFSVTYGILPSIIFGAGVTGIFVYCIKIAKNIWIIFKRGSQGTNSVSQEASEQSIEEVINEPPEECQK